MANNGLIIRLIDVAMIILFGFIAISDIKVRAQIKLPDQEDEQQTPAAEIPPVVYFVKIGLGKEIVVEHENEALFSTTSLTDLEEKLARASAEVKLRGRSLIVLIEPDEASPIQFTVDVLDICERNEIPKNINYESMQF